MNTPPITLSVAMIEGMHLARLVDDFMELLRDTEQDDPGVARLTPNAYPDDDDASVAFASATRADLLDRRLHDARTMRASLQVFDPDAEVTDEDARVSRDVRVRREDVDAWLRTLTAIRLVIATRLGITDDAPDVGGDGQAVYDWLGYRLELLIEAVDESDADALR